MAAPTSVKKTPIRPKRWSGRLEILVRNMTARRSRKPFRNRPAPNFVFPWSRGWCTVRISPTRRAEAHRERGRLAVVPAKDDGPEIRDAAVQLVKARHRVVAGSVVHDQDLVALPEGLEIHRELLEERLQILALVVDRNEHGEIHLAGPRVERRALHHVFRCHSHWRKSPRSIEVRGRNPRSRRASFVSADVSRGSPCCGSTWRRASFFPTSRSISSSTSRSSTRCPPPPLYANSGTGRVRLDTVARIASSTKVKSRVCLPSPYTVTGVPRRPASKKRWKPMSG